MDALICKQCQKLGCWRVEESTKPWYCSDYNEPATLFATCIRYFALNEEEFSTLPELLFQKIESLKYEMSIIGKMHQEDITLDLSWIVVGNDGNLDWRKTYAKCYREMLPDHFFIFAAMNGIATKALWERLFYSEQHKILNSFYELIRNTARLMSHPAEFYELRNKSILSAAQYGWPAAVCAWIGLRNNTLNNINYQEELVGNFFEGPMYDLSFCLRQTILVAIINGQFHLLHYLPAVNFTDSYDLFPFAYGEMFLRFFRELINYPATETFFNEKLSDCLKPIARILYASMSFLDFYRLGQMIVNIRDIKTLNRIKRFLHDISN
ncbi:unnamed protein product [Brugia timori]|uniref:Uncharacterized protein n=1 Tax=Brugia timori TaxID=42155 RepID=A0A0R3R078_9BILA|nr:unnamed protein product [Brugia timori]